MVPILVSEDNVRQIKSTIATIVERIKADAIGGAADTAIEVVDGITKLIRDSKSSDTETLIKEVENAAIEILRVLPSMAPPINGLHCILAELEKSLQEDLSVEYARKAACKVGKEFTTSVGQAIERVAEYGSKIIEDGTIVFMYSMSSTVWKILRKAKQQGKRFRVIVTESRPGNEGLWTVAEMEKAGITASISIDACIGELVPQVDLVFVGADSISSAGTVLNKVGTRLTALVAHEHGVPFYVAADTLKFDTSTLIGLPFRIDRIPSHIFPASKSAASAEIVGHLFDVTPPELITAIVTERGFVHPSMAGMVIWQMRLSKRLNILLPAWAHGEL
jgi:ribose 1,5-bisphosphate isomerase